MEVDHTISTPSWWIPTGVNDEPLLNRAMQYMGVTVSYFKKRSFPLVTM